MEISPKIGGYLISAKFCAEIFPMTES